MLFETLVAASRSFRVSLERPKLNYKKRFEFLKNQNAIMIMQIYCLFSGFQLAIMNCRAISRADGLSAIFSIIANVS